MGNANGETLSREGVLKTVVAILVETFGFSADYICTMNEDVFAIRFAEYLEMDASDRMQLILQIEHQFDIRISDDKNPKTIGAAVDLILVSEATRDTSVVKIAI